MYMRKALMFFGIALWLAGLSSGQAPARVEKAGPPTEWSRCQDDYSGRKFGILPDQLARPSGLGPGACYRMSGFTGLVSVISITPNGQTMLASDFSENALRLWDMQTWRELAKIRMTITWAMALSPDGTKIAGCGGNEIQIADVSKGNMIRTFRIEEYAGARNCLRFTRDGKSVVINGKGAIEFWDVESGKRQRSIPFPAGISMCDISPDEKLGAATTHDDHLIVVDLESGTERWKAKHSLLTRPAFSPDGKILAAGSTSPWDTDLWLWDAATGRILWQTKAHDEPKGIPSRLSEPPLQGMTCVTFSPDGTLLATGGKDHKVCLWDVKSGKLVSSYEGHTDKVTCLSFFPDGQTLASGGFDRRVFLWDIKQRVIKRRLLAVEMTQDEIKSAWAELGKIERPGCYRAFWRLIAAGKLAAPFFKQTLRPVPEVDEKHISQLIKDLDNNDFTIRGNANKELEKMKDLAEPALVELVTGKPTPEQRDRATGLIERLAKLDESPDRVQMSHAIMILERIGTAEAREVLAMLAKGAKQSRITREAQATRLK